MNLLKFSQKKIIKIFIKFIRFIYFTYISIIDSQFEVTKGFSISFDFFKI
jgi:hypothetical protein